MACIAPVRSDSHIYLVDASGFIYRAYHALPSLTRRSDGHPVGAVSGFCNMIWKLLADARKGDDAPTHLACVFDRSARSFRNDLDPRYKAQRPPAPDDLAMQFPLVREATAAFGLPVLEAEGYEADDIIAACVAQARQTGAGVTIVSSDKDLMQLVGDGVRMLDPMKNKVIGPDEVRAKFGVGPDLVADVLALAGDNSDNIAGVTGIGVVTAAQLINEFGDLESLLAGADSIPQPARRRNLIADADEARLAKKLVTLDMRAPTGDIDSMGLEASDPGTLVAFLEEMGFRTLTRRVREAAGEAIVTGGQSVVPPVDHSGYRTLSDAGTLQAWVARAAKAGVVAVHTEWEGPHPVRSVLVGLSLALGPGDACYIPLRHEAGGLIDADGGQQIPVNEALTILRPLFADMSVLKIGQNIKSDMILLAASGVTLAPIDDSMMVSFVTAAGKHGHALADLSRLHLDHDPIKRTDVIGRASAQVGFERVGIAEATVYAAEAADIALRLWTCIKPALVREKVCAVYETIERPLIPVVAEMEKTGILLDRARLSALSADFAARMDMLSDRAWRAAGRRFNLASPRQIGDILFGEMGLQGGRKTPKGAWSTAAGTLENLAANGHELADILLQWRMVSKLKNTYADALVGAISPETGRVHTSFSLVGAQTGRLSSTDPNLQNIPVRTEDGRKIRAAFIAPPGWVLVSADYSQIELRLLAHIAGIEALKRAFASGLDIHTMTASEIFGIPADRIDAATRRRAKAINFGIIYGISAFGLANQLAIPRGQAADYIAAYLEKFPGIAGYMGSMKAYAHRHGHVRTIFGRRCWTPLIASKKPAERAFAERQAINAPIQGAAADIIKRAMVRLSRALHEEGLRTRMLLQVHDELVFEAPESEAGRVMELARDIMSGAALPAVAVSVRLEVATQAAENWAKAH